MSVSRCDLAMTRDNKKLRLIKEDVVKCLICPRLVEHREQVAIAKIRRFENEDYWGRPVPGFGDPYARLLVVGLAPGAHGANRTGRVFTGDRSGDWLYQAMHRYGFANQKTSRSVDDGLNLIGAYVSAAVRCVPPSNKPTRQEIKACRTYLARELDVLTSVKVVLGLGKIGFDGFLAAWCSLGRSLSRPKPLFSHGSNVELSGGISLLGSYHPSQQNTFTRRLTRTMFHRIFKKARKIIDERTHCV